MRRLAAAVSALCLGIALSGARTVAFADGASWRLEKQRQHEARQQSGHLQTGEVINGIVGGVKAPAGQWPFQIALLFLPWGGSNYDMEYCGGSLVDSLHVVIAAHCVFGKKPSKFNVLTGTQSLASGGKRHALASIKVHPKYNDKTTDYDIAVITLAKPATGIAFYSQLITSAQEASFAKAGTKAYVAGWGSTVKTGGGYPTDLMQVGVPLVSRTDCNDANSYKGGITKRMICAGLTAGGKDSCDGDSGGPLVVKDSLGRWRLQAGIVSWGDGCAEPNLFGVYSRLAVLSDWANGVLAADARSNVARPPRNAHPNVIETLPDHTAQ
jgi:trypsin